MRIGGNGNTPAVVPVAKKQIELKGQQPPLETPPPYLILINKSAENAKEPEAMKYHTLNLLQRQANWVSFNRPMSACKSLVNTQRLCGTGKTDLMANGNNILYDKTMFPPQVRTTITSV